MVATVSANRRVVKSLVGEIRGRHRPHLLLKSPLAFPLDDVDQRIAYFVVFEDPDEVHKRDLEVALGFLFG